MDSSKFLAAIAVSTLVGCGGGGSEPSYTISGTVSGLSGSGLVLQATGGNILAVSASGGFRFPTALANGSAYTISVQTQPSSPSQTCAISPANGTISGANVSNVVVACSTNGYKIGGSVSGLEGTGLVLSDNGGDALAVSADGHFDFASAVLSGQAYAVTIQSQPASPGSGLNVACTVTSGAGTVAAADVDTVAVNCATAALVPGGTTMATSDGHTLSLFKVSSTWGTTGAAPSPFQTISTPNITGLAADPAGTIYYTANTGTPGSNATFYVCPAPTPGQSYTCSPTANASLIAGGKLLSFDPVSGYLLAAKFTPTGTTIVEFPAGEGPTNSNQQLIYTSAGTPVSVDARVSWEGNQEYMYVTEIPSGSTFGSGVKAFACAVGCATGTQLDITQSVLAAVGTPALLSGALGLNGNVNGYVIFGLANAYGQAAAPSALPIAISCAAQLFTVGNQSYFYQFFCNPLPNNTVTYPALAGGLSPFISTAGLAVDAAGRIYEAVGLTNQGQTITSSLLDGYSFFGFLGYSPTPFSCSVTPANCPVDLLPSLPVSANGGPGTYLLAISPNCQQMPGSTATYCGTFKVTWTNQSGSDATVSLDGQFSISTVSISQSVGEPGTGNLLCQITLLGGALAPTTEPCDSTSYYTAAGALFVRALDGQINLNGTILNNAVSGNTTGTRYRNTTGTGTGSFAGTATSQ
jgi:hypothetical protein